MEITRSDQYSLNTDTMSLRTILCFTVLVAISALSSATQQYEVRMCVVGKSTPHNTYGKGYSHKRVGRYGLYGDCECFEKPVGCPRLWYPQYNEGCNHLNHWLNIPQKHTELEEITNWRTTTVEEVHRTPVETWNVKKTPVETWNVQRNKIGTGAVVNTNVKSKAYYGATRNVTSIYTKKRKSFAKPVKRYRTKEVITYRRVRVEYIQCCPPLKFWFFDFPDFVDVNDASNPTSPTERFTKK